RRSGFGHTARIRSSRGTPPRSPRGWLRDFVPMHDQRALRTQWQSSDPVCGRSKLLRGSDTDHIGPVRDAAGTAPLRSTAGQSGPSGTSGAAGASGAGPLGAAGAAGASGAGPSGSYGTIGSGEVVGGLGVVGGAA